MLGLPASSDGSAARMRIRIIWLVLPAILAASQADRALAQERIDTSKFSGAAKAKLSNGAQAVDILNRIDALFDRALVGPLNGKIGRLQVFLYDYLGEQFWPAPTGADDFYFEVWIFQEHHGPGSFTQRTFVPAGGLCELSVNHHEDSFLVDLKACRELIESDMETEWWIETGGRADTYPHPSGFRQMPPNEELMALFPPPPITQEQLIKMLP